MPDRKKKDHKCSHHTSASHWQNFHFSGKLIVCSVIFGFMLILIGGIVYAIGTDRDDDTKSDDYEDLQKKPPMAIVGPVMMGIGGFIVFVGVGMCLVETNVCRRRNVENSPLIDGESGPKDSEATGIDSDATAIPSSSHKHRNRNRNKSPSPRRAKLHSKKTHFTKDGHQESISPRSPSSAPIDVGGNTTKNFLSASDKFLTPPDSFAREMQSNSRDAENQTSSSLMRSFTSSGNSWTASTEFQTPNSSSIEDSMCLEPSKLGDGMKDNLDPNTLTLNSHIYLTPKCSNAEMVISAEMNASKVLITNDSIENNGSDPSSYNAATQNEEIKQKLLYHSDAPIAASTIEIAEPEIESIESDFNSSDSTVKELEPSTCGESEGNTEPHIGVVIENTSKIDEDHNEEASEKEIITKHSKELPLDSSLKGNAEQNSTNQELAKEELEITNRDILVVNEDNQILKDLEESSTKQEPPSQIIGKNNKQEKIDDSQEKNSESTRLGSVETITENESRDDVSEASQKCSLNNHDT